MFRGAARICKENVAARGGGQREIECVDAKTSSSQRRVGDEISSASLSLSLSPSFLSELDFPGVVELTAALPAFRAQFSHFPPPRGLRGLISKRPRAGYPCAPEKMEYYPHNNFTTCLSSSPDYFSRMRQVRNIYV